MKWCGVDLSHRQLLTVLYLVPQDNPAIQTLDHETNMTPPGGGGTYLCC